MNLPWFAFKSTFKYSPDDAANSGSANTDGANAANPPADDTNANANDDNANANDDGANTQTDEELAQATNLMHILRDPAQRRVLVQSLAEREGILEAKTPQQVKKVVKNVSQMVRENLQGYEFLAPKFEKILTDFEEMVADKYITPVVTDVQTSRQAQANKEVEIGLGKAFASFKEAPSLEADVLKLSNELRPAAGQSPEIYFKRLIRLVADEKGIKLTPTSTADLASSFTADRRDKNRGNANLNANTAGNQKTTRDNTVQPMTADQAVAQAAADLARKGMK